MRGLFVALPSWRGRRVRAGRVRAPSHASLLARRALASLVALVAVGPGCRSDGVEARAIWVDASSSDRLRRIHVYDGGERTTLEVAGETQPQEFVRLGPRGRGALVRLGADANNEAVGAWLSLVDGRRLVMELPRLGLGQYPLSFSQRGDALLWIEDGGLELVPLAPGLDLERDEQGVAHGLRFEGLFGWFVSARQVPVVLARTVEGDASFIRYPHAGSEAVSLTELARVESVDLPGTATVVQECTAIANCSSRVSLAPRGERAIVHASIDEFVVLDQRPRAASGTLALPPDLADPAASGQLSLFAVLGPTLSVWASPGQLHLWDERRAVVESIPIFIVPPLWWGPALAGEALSLVSAEGPMIRVDGRGIELLSLETSVCELGGSFAPVLSPAGRWAAWTCVEGLAADEEPTPEGGNPGNTGVVIRVSADGLERFSGVPMRALAIDDQGDLLLYSTESAAIDEIDDVGSRTRPRNLFVLSRSGVLTRIDELEPAPAPVLIDADVSTFIQAIAD